MGLPLASFSTSLLEVQIRLTLVGFSLSIFDQRIVFSYLVNVEEGEHSIYQMNTFVVICAHPPMY
jgi:hypothetical protein